MKNVWAYGRWFSSLLNPSKSTLTFLEKTTKLKPSYVFSMVCAKFLRFVPNVSVRWRWPEVYCNRSGWFKVLLISGRFNTRLVTIWLTLLQPLNLVGTKADERCTAGSNFPDVLRSLDMLLSLSCLTFVIVCSKMSENDVKHLLRTEVSCCAHVEDCNAVAGNCIYFFLTSLKWFYR